VRQLVLRALLALQALYLTSGVVLGDDSGQTLAGDSLATRPALLDFPGSPKDVLRSDGITVDLWITQFYQGLTAGKGSPDWQYGGKADVFVTFDGEKLGLWHGLYVNLHQEAVWNQNLNLPGGTLLPVNTALAWPTAGGYNTDTSIIVTQNIGERVSLTFGKFNMLDQAYKTPIRGGGGYDEFMNITPTAPVTGLIPAYLIGANLTIKTEPAIFSLFVYDPGNAQIPAVIDRPFNDGVTINASVTIPVTIAGLGGYQGVKAVYSNLKGLDLQDIPQLFLPPQART
jgi:porin